MKKVLSISLGIGIVAALVAICFFVFHIPDFWPQLLAIIASAFLGAGVTAWITNTLLDNKQRSEEEKEKNLKVYEEKLRIYQDFLKCLYEVIKDDKVTKDEAMRLQFQTSYITMHAESEHIKVIAQQVESLVRDLNKDNNAHLMQCLFAIVEEFRKDLYPNKPKKDSDRENIDCATKSFITIMDAVEMNENNDLASGNNSSVDVAQNLNDFAKALLVRLEPHMKNWSLKSSESTDNGIFIKLGLNGHEEDVCVCISYEKNGEHYFQVHIKNDDPHEFYKQMKWEFGGRQNQWCWWKYLDANWRLLANSHEIKNSDWDKKLLPYVEEELKKLLKYAEDSCPQLQQKN